MIPHLDSHYAAWPHARLCGALGHNSQVILEDRQANVILSQILVIIVALRTAFESTAAAQIGLLVRHNVGRRKPYSVSVVCQTIELVQGGINKW